MTMNDESRASVAQPIVLDIGKAVQQLEENPKLAQHLNELAFGKFAADQLSARDALIEELVEALYRLSQECKLSDLADKAGFDCWLSLADKTLTKARGH